MFQIIEYEVKTPILVTRKSSDGTHVISIPEGGSLGFCGVRLYEKNSSGVWSPLVTPKNHMIEWLELDHVKKKAPVKTDGLKAFRKAAEKIKSAAAPAK